MSYRAKALRETIGDNNECITALLSRPGELTAEQKKRVEDLRTENQKLREELGPLQHKEDEIMRSITLTGIQDAASLQQLQERYRNDPNYVHRPGEQPPSEESLRGAYEVDELAAEAQRAADVEARTRAMIQTGIGTPTARASAGPSRWVDQNGMPVYMLAKGQNWSDLPGKKSGIEPGLGIGDFVRGAIIGGSKVSPGIRAALGEGTNQGGGVLVPDEMMRRLVDRARPRSVIMQAGAQTVPMTSETLRLARVSGDPTVETKEENAAFSGSDATFDSITFTTHTMGILLKASRELAEDAPNFASQVEMILTNAFASKLDDIAINGISTGIDGMLDWASGTGFIGETGSIGAITWEDLHTAVVTLQLLNYQPNAYVLNPEISGDLAVLTTGDGTNSAKGWLPPPSTVAPLMSLPTTHISNASIVVGDFTQLVWGIRHGAMIETTTVADDAFAKHQVWVKLTWRGDLNALRRDAFHRLVGVTS